MGKIIWLASYPKSGNTWLRAFIHNLLRNPPEPFDINELTRFAMHDSDAHRFRAFDSRPATSWSKAEVAALRPRVHEKLTQAFPDLVFVKTHNALVMDRDAPMISMEHTAGAIYIVRNPLDIVFSLADHNGETLDEAIDELARPMETENRSDAVYERRDTWSAHVASWTGNPHPALHVVRYEDALTEPFKVFSGIARFLGLDPPPARIEKAIKFSSFETLRDQEDKKGFKERTAHQKNFFRAGKAGAWRDVLSADQVARVVASHREQMARFSYLPADGKAI